MRSFCALLVVLSTVGLSQQPNSTNALMVMDWVQGPPYPIQVPVPSGLPATLALGSASFSVPFAVFAAANGGVQPGALVLSAGVVDLSLSSPPIAVMDGFSNPAFSTVGGAFSLTFTAPTTALPVGTLLALQAAVADPAIAGGLRLTAASQLTVIPGTVTVPLALGNNSSVAVTLGTPGFTVPYFGAAYNTLYVDSNGYVSFAPTASRPVATPAALHAGPPTIAGCWTDLDPTLGGTVSCTYTVNTTIPGSYPYAQVDFVNVPDALGTGVLHTFSIVIDAGGGIVIHSAASSVQGTFPTILGVDPGFALSGAGPTALGLAVLVSGPGPLFGAPNQAIYELFGLPSMPTYAGTVANPFNLPGTHLHFEPTGAGAPPGSSLSYLLY